MKVSEDPIRRDLRELAASGLLQRVHGGALIAAPATASYTERQMPAPQERKALACTGAQLIRPRQVAILYQSLVEKRQIDICSIPQALTCYFLLQPTSITSVTLVR